MYSIGNKSEVGMNAGPLNIAVVGLGDVAQEHMRIWRKLNNVRLAAVCDSNELRAREVAGRWGIPFSSGDFGEIIRRESISIIDICTPPQTHCSLILQALNVGRHVIVEKPLATTTDESEMIVSAQIRSDAKITVIHNWLYVPVMIRALSLVRNQVLGEILNVEIKALSRPDDAMLSNEDHWCHVLAGGRFGEMLAHPIYIIQALLRQPEVKSMQSLKLCDRPWVGSDELWVNLEANRACASIYASFNSCRDNIIIDIYATNGILNIDIDSDSMVRLGSRPRKLLAKGMDSLWQACQLSFSISRGAVSKVSGRWMSGTELCIRAFVESVLNDREPVVTLRQACDTVELLERICQHIESPSPRQDPH